MSANDRIINDIVTMIADGELTPGDRLPPEAELAARIGTSRGSLREAVRVLVSLGILDVRVGDGTYVTSLDGASLLRGLGLIGQVATGKTALEIFEIRRILESAAAEMAASRITDDELAELRQVVEQLEVETDGDRFVELDMRFHDLIAAAAGNQALQVLVASFSVQTQRARLVRSRYVDGILQRSTDEHGAIFRHIEGRQPSLAAAAAAAHVANVEHWLRQTYEDAALIDQEPIDAVAVDGPATGDADR
ncbi:MAG: FCD domain-containing protein [Actinomycetota bacterium]